MVSSFAVCSYIYLQLYNLYGMTFHHNHFMFHVAFFVLSLNLIFRHCAFISNRCGAQQSGDLGSSAQAVDGILGFGQSNSSLISQLASSGEVKKMFAHCLDSVDGGGIFAIGHVVHPKVRTTPLVPNQYVIYLQ